MQAGIKNIALYENKAISFRHFDPLNLEKITNISNQGSTVLIENYQQPNFEIKKSFSKGGRIVQDFIANFFLFELNVENYELIEQLQNSIYGWCPLIEFYDGTFKYYNTPLICREGEIKPHKEMAFEIKMENVIPTTKGYYDYTPGVSLIPVYRFDTELISWDNEIYSWDYEL